MYQKWKFISCGFFFFFFTVYQLDLTGHLQLPAVVRNGDLPVFGGD